ncbi:MAG: dnaJ 1 [Nocardioidaceae bacterium]|nr:dnaJ 1 [Nocardioidaceae bacterium]
MSASWYDVLGVAPDATAEQVKAAWREATDKFEPGQGSGQFRMFNEAADVLLDPERRAAYDTEIGVAATPKKAPAKKASAKKATPRKAPATKQVGAEAPNAEPAAGSVAVEDLPPPAPDTRVTESDVPPTHEESAPTRPAPAWLMVLLAVLAIAVVAVAAIFWTQNRQADKTDNAGDEATASAERALPAVLSYNYQQLTANRDQAARFLSQKYAKEYTATFDKLINGTAGQPGPATQAKAVVKASVEDIGVVSAQDGRVRLVVFLNQTTSKDGAAPTLSLNRLTVSMVKSGNTWLVDNINSY